LLPEPPWYYSGDLLTVEYRVNPDRVLELLPEPLGPAPDDPGAVAFIWADWQSCSQDKEQPLDPILGQYKEASVVVRCPLGGSTFTRCVYIWVDSDFAIARCFHQGYPKRCGSIHQAARSRTAPRRSWRPGPGSGRAGGRGPAAGRGPYHPDRVGRP
jgi:hypothetical protein